MPCKGYLLSCVVYREVRVAQPLMPPAASPARILRWKIRKKMIVGTAAIADAASTMFSGAVWAASQMPTLSVSLGGLYPPSTSSGHRKSFHTATSAKIDTTARIGLEIGIMIDRRVRRGDAPSMAAASVSSAGIESKNRLSRKMLNPLATLGSQIAAGEPIRLMFTIGRCATVI